MTPAAEARSRRTSAGFTLVELMMALAIIAIALFGILSMIIQTMAMRETARENQLAKEWVQQRIEEVKTRPYSDLKTVAFIPAGGTTVHVANFSSPNTPPQLAEAAGVLRVDYTDANLCEIVATIHWKGRTGRGMYSMRTLSAK